MNAYFMMCISMASRHHLHVVPTKRRTISWLSIVCHLKKVSHINMHTVERSTWIATVCRNSKVYIWSHTISNESQELTSLCSELRITKIKTLCCKEFMLITKVVFITTSYHEIIMQVWFVLVVITSIWPREKSRLLLLIGPKKLCVMAEFYIILQAHMHTLLIGGLTLLTSTSCSPKKSNMYILVTHTHAHTLPWLDTWKFTP